MIVIEFSEEALAYIGEKKSPVVIDMPYKVSSCCFDMEECPAVHFGEPGDMEAYTRQDSQGVTLYVPHSLSGAVGALSIHVRNFMGFRGLVMNGWKPI